MRILAALVLLLAAAVPALAGEATGGFEVRYAPDDQGLATEIDSDVLRLVDEVWRDLDAGKRWDPVVTGPFSTIKRDSIYVTSQRLTGFLEVEIVLNTTTDVPSERAATLALSRRFLEDLATALASAVERHRQFHITPLRSAMREASVSTKVAQQELAAYEAEWGDLEVERDVTASRLRKAAADLADARIQRAVLARQLERTRKAVESAAKAVRLRRQADAVRLRLESGSTLGDAEVESTLRKELLQLEALLDSIEQEAPALDEARRRTFDLEVELVGMEAKEALLRPEVAELRDRTRELGAARRAHQELLRTATARRDAETKLAEQLRAAELQTRNPTLVVTRSPAVRGPEPR